MNVRVFEKLLGRMDFDNSIKSSKISCHNFVNPGDCKPDSVK